MAKFKLGRDSDGHIDYGIRLSNMKISSVALIAGEEAALPLAVEDKTAVIFPSLGANYLVSNNGVVSAPSAPTGGFFNADTACLNMGIVSLDNWMQDSGGNLVLYVHAIGAMSMTVLVG